MPRETKGVGILSIRLARSSFAWLAKPDVAEQIGRLPAAQRQPALQTNVTTKRVAESAPDYSLALTIDVRGLVGEVSFWELHATFVGDFRREADSEINESDLQDVLGPAWIYSFAREYVADVTRRANIGAGVMLPPVNFKASK